MRKTARWEIWAQIITFLLGIAGFLLLASFLMMGGFSEWLDGRWKMAGATWSVMLSVSLAVMLLAAGVWFGLQALDGRRLSRRLRLWLPVWAYWLIFFVFMGLLALGNWLLSLPHVFWLAWVALSLPVTLLPIMLVFFWAVRGLDLGSPLRFFGVVGSDMLFSPVFILIFEFFALVFLVGALAFWTSHRDIFSWLVLHHFLQDAVQNGLDIYRLQDILLQYVNRHPWILGLAAGYLTLLIPLLEELLKPVGVWALGSRLASPSQGFALGALSGAIFAWFENAMAVSTITNDWLSTSIVRALTPALHIAASALVGWGIALLRREKRWGAFLGLLSLALVLHAVWNGMSVLALGNLWGKDFSGVTVAGFVFLYALALTILGMANARLRRRDIITPQFD